MEKQRKLFIDRYTCIYYFFISCINIVLLLSILLSILILVLFIVSVFFITIITEIIIIIYSNYNES